LHAGLELLRATALFVADWADALARLALPVPGAGRTTLAPSGEGLARSQRREAPTQTQPSQEAGQATSRMGHTKGFGEGIKARVIHGDTPLVERNKAS
jgi:hypothetical protein